MLRHSVVSDSVPMGSSPPGSSVHGIFQAGILEWVTIPFPRGSSQPGVKPASLVSPVLAGGLSTAKLPGKPRRWGGVKVRASPGVRIQDCVSTSLGQDMRRWDFSSLSFLFLKKICDHSLTVGPWECELKLFILKKEETGNSLGAQWLGLHTFIAEDAGSIPS